MEGSIEKHRTLLEDRMDANFGLLDKLIKTLSKKERRILEDTNAGEKNEKLLNYILKKNKGHKLIEALRDTGQAHLVNCLQGDGVYNPDFGDDWPLGEREMNILEENHESLVDLLETEHGLCDRLRAKKIINSRQKEFILSKPTDYRKNKVLLDMLEGKSLRHYHGTISCLRASNQSHIAKILSEGGVVLQIHANFQGSEFAEEDFDEEENIIVAMIKKAIGDGTLEESNSLLKLVQLGLIAAKRGDSVVLYFHCVILEELENIHKTMANGELGRLAEVAFNQFLRSADVRRVKLDWNSEGDYDRCRRSSLLQLDHLPLEQRNTKEVSHEQLFLRLSLEEENEGHRTFMKEDQINSNSEIAEKQEEPEGHAAQNDTEERIKRHRDLFEDRMDPYFGLLDVLHAKSTLTREEMVDILLDVNTTEIKNRKILDYVLEKHKTDELMAALSETGQTHLINYLMEDGVHCLAGSSFKFGDDWPLGEKELMTLKVNQETLIDLLDMQYGLCDRLYNERVISRRQKDFISTKTANAEKTEALLHILERSSLRQYRKTIECMCASNQSHVAEILSEGKVFPAVHPEASASTAKIIVGEAKDVLGIVGELPNLLQDIIGQEDKHGSM